ncbi:DUF317 domain-containing protein [Streptomyces sp. NPDC058872]|uniref:DUF317 domain-containing protein n=1 Tax=Streptomyces sp. NPDC058872 TaxID=3346661 RepID=UPI0036CC3573
MRKKTVEQALITPGYLAGPGDPAWVTTALHAGAGWNPGHDPLAARVVLTSPNGKSMLRLEPALNGPWWHLSHNDGRTGSVWSAHFDGATPVELIAAVTDALTHPDYSARAADPSARAAADPYKLLHRAGWDIAANSDFRSPDRRVRGERHNFSGSTDWHITATLDWDDPLWRARLSSSMPRVLVSTFLQALADPEPVIRSHEQTQGLSLRRITMQWREVPAESAARVLPERIERLAARRASPPAAPPAAPPARRRTR